MRPTDATKSVAARMTVKISIWIPVTWHAALPESPVGGDVSSHAATWRLRDDSRCASLELSYRFELAPARLVWPYEQMGADRHAVARGCEDCL
jgi:hypothetical protein